MKPLKRVYVHGKTDQEPWGWMFWCPGCNCTHPLPVEGPNGWTFNGNEESPTFTPSLLNHEVKREDGSVYSPRCHLFVNDGKIQFLSDCGHELAGQTVPMVDYEESFAAGDRP